MTRPGGKAPAPVAALLTAAAALALPGALVVQGAFLLHPAPAAADEAMGQRDVEEGLTCQCGCGLTVASCNHLDCGFAVPARKEVAEALERGESGQAILEGFKQKYGEKVLSSPVPEGFNLLAWIAPYVAIAVAGLAMFTFFRRRARGAAAAAAAAPPAAPPPRDDARLARLRDEVEEMER